jgi:hypothetical protein
MQLTKGQLIGGVPAIEVRQLLRVSRGGFEIGWLTDRGYSKAKARKLVDGLLQGGYIEVELDKRARVSLYNLNYA